MRRLGLLTCGVTVFFLSADVFAREEAAKPTDAAAAIKAQIHALRKEQSAAERERTGIRRKIEKSEAIMRLRGMLDKADKAYQKKKNETVGAAQKAERAAAEAFKALVRAKTAAAGEGAALLKKIADLDAKRASLSMQAAMADLKLRHRDSQFNRALAADEALAKLKQAYRRADRDARDQARKAYEEAKEAAFVKAEGKALTDEIQTARKAKEQASKAIHAARSEFDKLRRSIEKGTDKEITAARAKWDAARKAAGKAYHDDELKATREVRNKARQAVPKGVEQLLAKDKAAIAASAKITKLRSQIRELHAKERELRKKK